MYLSIYSLYCSDYGGFALSRNILNYQKGNVFAEIILLFIFNIFPKYIIALLHFYSSKYLSEFRFIVLRN